MKRQMYVAMALVLGLWMMLSGVVWAVSSDPARPLMLTSTVPQSGTLAGNTGGAFHYFAIDYPGDERPVTIRLSFSPGDPATSSGVGFNIYGRAGYFIGGGRPAGQGVLELAYADDVPARWLIQVYNYLPGQSINYTVVVSGLPFPPAMPVQGTLVGSSGGAFAFYNVDYPGDGRIVSLELSFGPDDPTGLEGMGFDVYGGDGRFLGRSHTTSEPGVRLLELGSDRAERWLVQVYNYWPGRTISYSFAAKGITSVPTAPPPAPTPPPSAPAAASVLAQSVSGVLPGSRTGAFARYEFTYPGDGSLVTINMAFGPDDPAISPGMGFMVYGPSGQVAKGAITGKPGERKATFSSSQGGTYLVQVYNYIEGITLHYTLSR